MTAVTVRFEEDSLRKCQPAEPKRRIHGASLSLIPVATRLAKFSGLRTMGVFIPGRYLSSYEGLVDRGDAPLAPSGSSLPPWGLQLGMRSGSTSWQCSESLQTLAPR